MKTRYTPKHDNTLSILIIAFFALLVLAALVTALPAIVTGLNLDILIDTLLGSVVTGTPALATALIPVKIRFFGVPQGKNGKLVSTDGIRDIETEVETIQHARGIAKRILRQYLPVNTWAKIWAEDQIITIQLDHNTGKWIVETE